jgi:hypothetical protein
LDQTEPTLVGKSVDPKAFPMQIPASGFKTRYTGIEEWFRQMNCLGTLSPRWSHPPTHVYTLDTKTYNRRYADHFFVNFLENLASGGPRASCAKLSRGDIQQVLIF